MKRKPDRDDDERDDREEPTPPSSAARDARDREQLDPQTERIERIREGLRRTGSTEVHLRVSRVMTGKGKVYLDTLRLHADAAEEYEEAVTSSFGGSGDGSYHIEFRVRGQVLGYASFVAEGDPFPVKRVPPASPAAAPPVPAPSVDTVARPRTSVEDELRLKLRKSIRRRRQLEEELRGEIEELRAELVARREEPAIHTSVVDEALKILEAKTPKADAGVSAQLAELQKKLDAVETERKRERDDRFLEKFSAKTESTDRELRLLRKKLRRAMRAPVVKEEDPFKEFIRLKTRLEEAKLAGADTGFVDKLSKRIDEKYGDRLLEFLDGKVSDVLPSGPAGPGPSGSKPSAAAEDLDAWREWLTAQFRKGLQFVESPNEVLEATKKFPGGMTKLAQVTSREQMIDFIAGLGFPRALVERQLTEDKAPAYVALLEKLRATLQTLAAQAASGKGAEAPAPAPPAASTPPPAPPAPPPSTAVAPAPAPETKEPV